MKKISHKTIEQVLADVMVGRSVILWGFVGTDEDQNYGNLHFHSDAHTACQTGAIVAISIEGNKKENMAALVKLENGTNTYVFFSYQTTIQFVET